MNASMPVPVAESPLVYVSIAHWNGGQGTIDCVASVFADGYPAVKVVVIDNGSTDHACAEIRSRWPDVTVLTNRVNQGFTGAHNQGITHAVQDGAAFVLLFNQDATFMPGCIGAMVALAATDERIGLVSPVIYYRNAPARIQFSGCWIERAKAAIVYSRDFDEVRAFERQRGRDLCLWGTALLMRRTMIGDVGVLDDRFFAYYEDTDYSVRASANGWTSRMCFDGGVLHDAHEFRWTRGPHVFYLSSRNAVFFWRKVFRGRRKGLFWRRKLLAKILHEAGTLQDAGLYSQASASIDGVWAARLNRVGPFDGAVKAPTALKSLLLGHPYFWSRLFDGSLFGRGR